jgi:hypothetical protein
MFNKGGIRYTPLHPFTGSYRCYKLSGFSTPFGGLAWQG